MNSIVVGYFDKGLNKVLFIGAASGAFSDVQSATTFKTKKEAKTLFESTRREFIRKGRKDIKLKIFRTKLEEVK